MALWCRHYGSASEADDAFYDSIRLFHPVPAILYDRGYPQFGYASTQEEADDPMPPSDVRTELYP